LADLGAKRELSTDEILNLLRRALTERRVASILPTPAATPRPHSISEVGVARELSLDEILQKVQRDIAEGRPAAA
jgi:hypothetical protein